MVNTHMHEEYVCSIFLGNEHDDGFKLVNPILKPQGQKVT